MVISQQGIVATSQTLASQAGASILAQGGSAVDAAIAANAVLGITEPMMNGIGGDLFVIYREARGQLHGLNASGWSPRGLTVEALAAKGIKDRMPLHGIHSATVPGCVDGWAKAHARFGKLPWKSLFTAAIFYAENGFPVTEVIQSAWAGGKNVLEQTPETRRVYLPVPKVGDVVRNPGYAKALRLIAEKGPREFYEGDIAKAMLATSERLGGTLRAEDLKEFSSEWVTPISADYRGWRVYELPPNGQGIAALQMLNIMETFAPSPFGPASAVELHKKIEAMKLAYADLKPYVADPATFRSPVAGLLDKNYARERAKLIDPAKANCKVPPGHPMGSDTTYLTVVDKEGNIASWIQSLSGGFGSGVTVEGFGFLLHNRGSGFELDPKVPNVVAGRKRPFHTIIPAYMEKDELHIGFGIMGGPNQPLAHAQFVSHLADYGMNIQQAVEAPRFTKRTSSGCDVAIESRVKVEDLAHLSGMGHVIAIHPQHTSYMGRGAVVLHNSKTKVNFGAADSRADGSAVPEPPPLK
jgi:gamma-glutamyltranspeptidase/glutathione hydrolase